VTHLIFTLITQGMARIDVECLSATLRMSAGGMMTRRLSSIGEAAVPSERDGLAVSCDDARGSNRRNWRPVD
jgi:hypothetical protein